MSTSDRIRAISCGLPIVAMAMDKLPVAAMMVSTPSARDDMVRFWQIAESGYNLDIKHPHVKQDLEHLPPEQLADSILRKEQRIAELMAEIKAALAG